MVRIINMCRGISFYFSNMKMTVIVLSVIFICGCASTSRRYYPTSYYKKKGFLELETFSKKYNLHYNFDTLDDILVFSSKDRDIKLLLSSGLIYFNGRIFSIEDEPYYSGGKIFIPADLGSIISLKHRKIRQHRLPMSIKNIVIDAGHGGKDPGALTKRGFKEKHINLKVARYLKEELQARGFNVYLTRDKDIYLTLKERIKIAKECDADLFISVHSNSNRSRKIRGVEVYYLSDKYFDSESKAVVLAENVHLSFNDNNLSRDTQRIIWDLICVENNTQSLDFASSVVYTLRKMGFKVREPRGAPFYVLKYAYTPSVLIEIGYLSNPHEEKLLRKAYYQKQIAKGIALSLDLLNKRYARLINISR